MDMERLVATHVMDVTGFKTVLEVPEMRPAEFVSVERVGGPAGPFSESPRFAVQSWAKTRKRAAEMDKAVRNALFSLMTLDCVFGVEVNSSNRWPDPQSGHERYQTVVTVTACE